MDGKVAQHRRRRKTCQFALTLWRKLTRFLEYLELEPSSNLAENSIRPVALGRKN
jgi:hypothetical protein